MNAGSCYFGYYKSRDTILIDILEDETSLDISELTDAITCDVQNDDKRACSVSI